MKIELLLHDSGGSPDMNINALDDVRFTLRNNSSLEVDRDFLVTELLIKGSGNGLVPRRDSYIGVNKLTGNGHRFRIRTDNEVEYDEKMFTSEDIQRFFCVGKGSKLDSDFGTMVAVFARPFFIRQSDRFDILDDIVATVGAGNNLSTIKKLQVSVVGFMQYW